MLKHLSIHIAHDASVAAYAEQPQAPAASEQPDNRSQSCRPRHRRCFNQWLLTLS